MNPLLRHPDSADLRQRIAECRAELAACLDRRVQLIHTILPSLREHYTALFGTLEIDIQQMTLEMSERKRAVELFTLKLDRGQKLDVRTVELVMIAVRGEFARIRSRVGRAIHLASGGRGPTSEHKSHSDTESAESRKLEMRNIYRRLVRQFHPDRAVSDDETTRRYWHLVQEANTRGDLALLRTIACLAPECLPSGISELDSLNYELTCLNEALRVERRRLDELQREEIYQIRNDLDNEEWVLQHRAGLQYERAGIESEIAKCDKFLAPILALGTAIPPEKVQTIWSDWVENMYINR